MGILYGCAKISTKYQIDEMTYLGRILRALPSNFAQIICYRVYLIFVDILAHAYCIPFTVHDYLFIFLTFKEKQLCNCCLHQLHLINLQGGCCCDANHIQFVVGVGLHCRQSQKIESKLPLSESLLLAPIDMFIESKAPKTYPGRR